MVAEGVLDVLCGWGMTIYPLKTFGVMTVLKRERKGETSVPPYIVRDDRTGRILEEFRRKAPAMKWAEKNRNG